jgi:hypothetical protein
MSDTAQNTGEYGTNAASESPHPSADSLKPDDALSPHNENKAEQHAIDAQALSPGASSNAFNITPADALKHLASRLNQLLELTGDIPLTPSITTPSTVNDSAGDPTIGKDQIVSKVTELHCAPVKEASGSLTQLGLVQQRVLSKRFYSKKAPPIALEEYLNRLHRYCPMSPAVYIATGLYITRMAVLERIISVAPRNIHRLVLAGLRVAMKALEDLSYPHIRFARVGGVSERELTRLEITFCFLTNFELRVDAQMLMSEFESLQTSIPPPPTGMELKLPGFRGATLLNSTSAPQEIAAGAPAAP